MSRPKNIQDALDEAVVLLERDKYKTLDKINEISRIFLAQAIVLELRQRYRLTFVRIGECVGVNEKTVRYDWLDANHCIEPENLIALARFYLKIRDNDG